MTRKILWNSADPSGYGVPGKPITPDQFYTEDVFLMLVPDDGLSPVKWTAPLGMRNRDAQIKEFADPEMEQDPRYDNDRPMEINPDGDDLCQDQAQVDMLIERHQTYVRELANARADLAQATSPQERADFERDVRLFEEKVAETKPSYDAAMKCRSLKFPSATA